MMSICEGANWRAWQVWQPQQQIVSANGQFILSKIKITSLIYESQNMPSTVRPPNPAVFKCLISDVHEN